MRLIPRILSLSIGGQRACISHDAMAKASASRSK
jgi:hypothetical protein